MSELSVVNDMVKKNILKNILENVINYIKGGVPPPVAPPIEVPGVTSYASPDSAPIVTPVAAPVDDKPIGVENVQLEEKQPSLIRQNTFKDGTIAVPIESASENQSLAEVEAKQPTIEATVLNQQVAPESRPKPGVPTLDDLIINANQIMTDILSYQEPKTSISPSISLPSFSKPQVQSTIAEPKIDDLIINANNILDEIVTEPKTKPKFLFGRESKISPESGEPMVQKQPDQVDQVDQILDELIKNANVIMEEIIAEPKQPKPSQQSQALSKLSATYKNITQGKKSDYTDISTFINSSNEIFKSITTDKPITYTSRIANSKIAKGLASLNPFKSSKDKEKSMIEKFKKEAESEAKEYKVYEVPLKSTIRIDQEPPITLDISSSEPIIEKSKDGKEPSTFSKFISIKDDKFVISDKMENEEKQT